MRESSWFGIGLLLAAACGDDQAAASGGGIETAATSLVDSGGSPAATDTGGLDDGPASGGDGTTALADPPLPFAHGVRLDRLTANQAVQVSLVEGGLERPPEEHGTRLIAGRTTLLRAYWSLHADFAPRELIGRLEIDYPDGSALTQDFPLRVEGPSSDAGASFQWLLSPEQVVPDMRYRVRVLEADPDAATGEISEPPPILPLRGRGTLAIYDATLELHVELIPILHQFEGQECMPTILEPDVEAMRQELEQNNPVQRAVLTVGEPMPYPEPIGTSGTGFGPVLSALAIRRAADEPAPNLYYYGLVEPCDGYPPGLLGQAIGIPDAPTMGLAQQRIATGRWSGSGAAAAETFVHEIGHTQGRYHVRCSGGEAGADVAYPHAQGRIGVWGFGIYDFQLRSPTLGRDYMTYCANEWVSDYAWEQTLDIIETLTSWDAAAPVPDGPGLLLGALHSDGTAQWWTARGALPQSSATDGARLEVTGPDGIRTLPALVYPQPDGDTLQVIAPRPRRLHDATALELYAPQRSTPASVSRAKIRDLYAPTP